MSDIVNRFLQTPQNISSNTLFFTDKHISSCSCMQFQIVAILALSTAEQDRQDSWYLFVTYSLLYDQRWGL